MFAVCRLIMRSVLSQNHVHATLDRGLAAGSGLSGLPNRKAQDRHPAGSHNVGALKFEIGF